MKKILFASSEAVPFIKTGGLADVVGSLPKYFPKKEYDVRVVVPKYMCMDTKYTEKMKLVTECQVQLNWRTQYAGVYELQEDGVTFYFIDNEYYFAGPAPYGQIYQDAEKFGYFSKAVLTILPEIGFQPDIIHCHDWQTGLIPVFLEAQFRQNEFYRYMRTVYTIHNMKFQGRWYVDAIRDKGVKIVAMGKWDNFLTVSCNDSAVIGEIAALPFVRATEKVWVAPSKPVAEDKRDSLANSPLKSENYYGPALRQIEISNGEKLHEAGFKGQGMTIAVIDAGYHNVDKIEAMKNIRILGTKDFVEPGSDIYAKGSHGMAVLSCMAMNDPYVMGVRLDILRV